MLHQMDPLMMQQLQSKLPSPSTLQSTPPPTQEHIRMGTRVQACSLVSVLQHNSCRGVVTLFDGSKQQYSVRLDSGKVLSLRPACVLQMAEVQLSNAGQGMWFDMCLNMCFDILFNMRYDM